MKKKKRTRPPNMLLWDRNQQKRFSEAVEQVVSVCRDLGAIRDRQLEALALANQVAAQLRELLEKTPRVKRKTKGKEGAPAGANGPTFDDGEPAPF